ncbi:MAG TPA: twin-arginine translocase TatA/TatE family subunit [Candidatus Limnocylindrales bacterium]
MPLGLTPAHLILILVIALIVVGPGRLPEVGSALGKSIKEFRKAASDIQESTSTSAAPVPAAAAPAPAPVQAAPAPALVQAAPVAAPVAAPFAPPPPPPAQAAAAPAAEQQPTDPATADESAVSPEVGA